MQSIFYPEERIEVRYDVKGCLAGRYQHVRLVYELFQCVVLTLTAGKHERHFRFHSLGNHPRANVVNVQAKIFSAISKEYSHKRTV